MRSDLGIVIVNWNSKDVIFPCLESIRKAGYIESIVVVDNASNDGSIGRIKNYESRIKVIENASNLGFAEGNNVGIRYLLGNQQLRYILILNPDTEITRDTIPNLIRVVENDEKIGICGPKIFSDHAGHLGGVPLDFARGKPHTIRGVLPRGVSMGHIWSCGGIIDNKRYSAGLIGLGEDDRGQYDKEKEVDFISGTAMFVKREVFEKCGLFYPDYFIYYEDVELNLKAKKAGFKLMFVPASTIIHHESASMGKNSPAQEYYMARNHLLFIKRNAPFEIKLRELVRLPKTLYEHWRKKELWAIRGIRDYFLRRFGKRDYWS